MMNLAELQPVATAALPLAELKDHLRLPDGFPDDGSFDDRLEQSLRAGLALAEARTGKALLMRQFQWQVEAWGGDRIALPVAPLVTLNSVAIRDFDGSANTIELTQFGVISDLHRPALVPRSGAFPTLAGGAVAELIFTAGFGADWTGVPPDLREAVLIMAVDFFDAPLGQAPGMTPSVNALLQRYRALSIGKIGA
ncbi:MAG: hypothetical protein AAGA70_04850 [Pseudomonadota bacterium]